MKIEEGKKYRVIANPASNGVVTVHHVENQEVWYTYDAGRTDSIGYRQEYVLHIDAFRRDFELLP